MTSGYAELSATEAVSAMVRGEMSAEAYAAALLHRCAMGHALNAFITLEPDRVLEAARRLDRLRSAGGALGALHGLPVPVKDSINTKELPTSAGTPALRGFKPCEDAPIVRTLLDAGGLILGKTNLHELSFGWTSNNRTFGAVRNPYDPARIPGGSSGGTGAAVAARMAPLGLAEDTEGSIRVPAALCGVAGFRPTTTRYPSTGTAPITPLFDQVGPIARCVSDLELFDSVATGGGVERPQVDLARIRLGVDRDYWFDGLDREVESVIAAALRRLQDAGVRLVEAGVPDLKRLIALTTSRIQNHAAPAALSEYLERHGAGIGFDELLSNASPELQRDFALNVLPGGANYVTAAMYRDACEVHLPALKRAYRDYFAAHGVDAIVFPATMIAAPPIGADGQLEVRGRLIAFETAIARNIAPGSTAGLPGLVLPAGMTGEKLPVAIELDAPAGADRALLALGRAVESLFGRLPPP